jgi:hypothetical protein
MVRVTQFWYEILIISQQLQKGDGWKFRGYGENI